MSKKRVCIVNSTVVHIFQLTIHFAHHRWWLGIGGLPCHHFLFHTLLHPCLVLYSLHFVQGREETCFPLDQVRENEGGGNKQQLLAQK